MKKKEQIDALVKKFNMQPHPEGGFYKETYRSLGIINKSALPETFGGDRNYSTAIYFLLTEGNFSAFHRIQQDELWHFYKGDSLEVHVIDLQGNYTCFEVNNHLDGAGVPQLMVPAGSWFASSVKKGGSYAFVGCTVAPGFDFADFELADRNKLSTKFPEHTKLIQELTRNL
ncbi:cupin domain-containing protein [Ascidiimonas sp. W6]|uniref:cupin domain-containing protein n=1 Tax=Ascidiimonas meishanensis TaxID=3128903 RepID=UPI0030EFA31D